MAGLALGLIGAQVASSAIGAAPITIEDLCSFFEEEESCSPSNSRA